MRSDGGLTDSDTDMDAITESVPRRSAAVTVSDSFTVGRERAPEGSATVASASAKCTLRAGGAEGGRETAGGLTAGRGGALALASALALA